MQLEVSPVEGPGASSTDHNKHEPTAERKGAILWSSSLYFFSPTNERFVGVNSSGMSSYLRFDIYEDILLFNVSFVEFPKRVDDAGEVGVAYSSSVTTNRRSWRKYSTWGTGHLFLQPTCPWIRCCRFHGVLFYWWQLFCPQGTQWSQVQTRDNLWASCWCGIGTRIKARLTQGGTSAKLGFVSLRPHTPTGRGVMPDERAYALLWKIKKMVLFGD